MTNPMYQLNVVTPNHILGVTWIQAMASRSPEFLVYYPEENKGWFWIQRVPSPGVCQCALKKCNCKARLFGGGDD